MNCWRWGRWGGHILITSLLPWNKSLGSSCVVDRAGHYQRIGRVDLIGWWSIPSSVVGHWFIRVSCRCPNRDSSSWAWATPHPSFTPVSQLDKWIHCPDPAFTLASAMSSYGNGLTLLCLRGYCLTLTIVVMATNWIKWFLCVLRCFISHFYYIAIMWADCGGYRCRICKN